MPQVILSPPRGAVAPKAAPEQNRSVIEKQLDQWQRGRDGMQPWAQVALICQDMLEGKQWERELLELLREQGRPAITLNKIKPLVQLLKGYFRQNRSEIAYLVGNDASGESQTAEALTLLSKLIDEMNGSDYVRAEVFADGLITGRGFFDTRLSFENNVLGEVQEVSLDPFSVIIDPEATGYESKDWGFVQNSSWMSAEDIKHFYGVQAAALIGDDGMMATMHPVLSDEYAGAWPDIAPERTFGLDEERVRDVNLSGFYGSIQGFNPFYHINRMRRLIRVIECQHRVWDKAVVAVDLTTGDTRPIPKTWPRERIAEMEAWCRATNQPISYVQANIKRVRHTVTAADRLLYDDWSLYNNFTINGYFPYFRRGKTMGMVEDLIDPQREINKRRSAALHIITTMANSGWLYEANSIDEDTEDMLENEGSRPGLMVKYKKDFEAPKRIEPGFPPTAVRMFEQAATDDLKEISGINESALGELDKVQSGRAVQARQQQSIVGAESYFDNWNRSLEECGRNRLDMIQNYYTEPRLLRSKGDEFGNVQEMVINGMWAGEVINNVAVGKYRISIDTRALSATFKDGQFQEAMELREKGVPMPDDILVDLSSMPKKDIIKARIEQAMAAQAAAAAMAPPGAPGAGPSKATPPAPKAA